MRITARHAFKSILGLALGAAPGLFCSWAFEYGTGYVIFISIVGAFIGFALTLPGVSARRVAGGTAATLIGYNTSEEWGKRLYEKIAGNEPQPTPPPQGVEPSPHSRPATSDEAATSKGFWWVFGGLAPLGITLLGASTQCQRMSERNKPLPAMSEDNFIEQIRLSEGYDSAVVLPKSTPKIGEPDAVEDELKSRLEKLRLETELDRKQIERIEKSLEYWRERKRREAASLSSHPPVVISIPQSR